MKSRAALGAGPPQGVNSVGPGGGRLPPSRGARDFFPLPLPAHATAAEVACRTPHMHHQQRQVTETLTALNWMAGYAGATEAPCEPDPLQKEVIVRVEGLVRDQEPTERPPAPEAALKELLKGRSLYEGGPAARLLPPTSRSSCRSRRTLAVARVLMTFCRKRLATTWRRIMSRC